MEGREQIVLLIKHVGLETKNDSIVVVVVQGYVLRITGGNDKQGFPMKQGVMTAGRVRLLLSKGHSCYRPRRKGERRRKSVHGCIVDSSLSVLSVKIVRKGWCPPVNGVIDGERPFVFHVFVDLTRT